MPVIRTGPKDYVKSRNPADPLPQPRGPLAPAPRGLTKLAHWPGFAQFAAVMRPRWIIWLAGGVIASGGEPPTPTPAANTDDLYKLGQQLFDQYAPPEVKDQYAFPTKGQWDDFAARLQHALDNNSLEELARFEPEARGALVALRSLPGYEGYA